MTSGNRREAPFLPADLHHRNRYTHWHWWTSVGSRGWDSLLQGVETPILSDFLSHEVCCMWRDCWTSFWPQTMSLCFSFTWAPKILLWVHQEWLQSPGGWAKGIRVQIYFLPVCWNTGKAHVGAHASWGSICVWHCRQHFAFYDYKTRYENLGVMGRDRIHSIKWGKNMCANTLAILTENGIRLGSVGDGDQRLKLRQGRQWESVWDRSVIDTALIIPFWKQHDWASSSNACTQHMQHGEQIGIRSLCTVAEL